MRLISSFTLLLCANLALSTPAFAEDWQLTKNKDDVKVYTRAVPNSPLKEFRGVTHINTSITSLVALLDDPAACVDWMHNCKEQKILDRPNLKEKYTYNHIGAPWPVKDRDMIVHSFAEQDPTTHRVHIKLTATKGYQAETSGIVRINQMRGYWDFNPLPNGTVEVTYQMFIDPAGSIPNAIINSTAIDTPFNTLKNMREKVREKKYQTRALESIKNPT